eukprot:TRINITY_DN11106_c1_g1_i1.p1 TRINITY_DN11106_c1_g1~~TRINITY_DN11106_c1_g1_i1.p1  ORF type:complete len:178 (-),score=14.27 TRINITY_DN11106_c1_g1_i1:33-566(-)
MPYYYSHLIVNSKSNYKVFQDLKGSKLAYNEESSLSGYFVVKHHLVKLGLQGSFFSSSVKSGAHVNSITMIIDNKADCAAIDSQIWTEVVKTNPGLLSSLRIIELLGPYPVQPFVVSSNMPHPLYSKLKQSLLQLSYDNGQEKNALDRCNLLKFTDITDGFYNQVETDLARAADISL